jgi:hypothetical protein
MAPDGDTHTGSQLDEDHAPETNGRMSVCRRCGSQTDGPAGRHHLPTERQSARVRDWLIAESRRVHLARARQVRG